MEIIVKKNDTKNSGILTTHIKPVLQNNTTENSSYDENYGDVFGGFSSDSNIDITEDNESYNNNFFNKKVKKGVYQKLKVAEEAINLFKTNIFKLKFEELKKCVSLKEKNIKIIENVLHKLHEIILEIPVIEKIKYNDALNYFQKKNVEILFPTEFQINKDIEFSYYPPESINISGSFGLKTIFFHPDGMGIDVSVLMPRTLFHLKDYMNFKCFYKKAFYMAYVAYFLVLLSKKNNLPLNISYDYLNGDVLATFLKITSFDNENTDNLCFNSTNFSINLLFTFPDNLFNKKKLSIDKACIKLQDFEKSSYYTRFYNSSILTQSLYYHYLKYVFVQKKLTPEFGDACIMGKIWLYQRGFKSSINDGGFGHFEFSILMTILLTGGDDNGNKMIYHGYSSYQLFKSTLSYLYNTDLINGHLVFSSDLNTDVKSRYLHESNQVPMIFDKSTNHNILWKMTSFSYKHLKKIIFETLETLNSSTVDTFDGLFLQKLDYSVLQYDFTCNLKIFDSLFTSFDQLQKVKFLTFENYIKCHLSFILENALDKRISNFNIKTNDYKRSFALNKKKSDENYTHFILGFNTTNLEFESLNTNLDSNENEQKISMFKSFWKDKVSIRKFNDGSIKYSVLWKRKNEPLIFTIIKTALQMHIHQSISHFLSSEDFFFTQTFFFSSIRNGADIYSLKNFYNYKNSFENLTKLLFSFKLQLHIKSISPISVSSRYTSILQPIPFAVSNPDFWNDIVLQFESSTGWPDQILALENTKSAFLLKINDFLNEKKGYKSFCTKNDLITFNMNSTFLNILTPDGFGFRIRIITERDEILYKRCIENSNKNKPLLKSVYHTFKKNYIDIVLHTRKIEHLTLHFDFYSLTVRFFKFWLDSQLILTCFSEELIELIALKPFVDPFPYSVPKSVKNGFFQILNFLSNWNWKTDPLILDLTTKNLSFNDDNLTTSDHLSIDEYKIIEKNFQNLRKKSSLANPCFFVATKDDLMGSNFSKSLPIPVCSRLTSLARIVINSVKSKSLNDLNLNDFFKTSLSDFDFVIYTNSHNLSNTMGINTSKFKNLVSTCSSFPDDIFSYVDFSSIYAENLKRLYENKIIFFYKKLSSDGTNTICGIFNPFYLNNKTFKVANSSDIKPMSSSDNVELNKKSILDQIISIGGDLVKSFEINIEV